MRQLATVFRKLIKPPPIYFMEIRFVGVCGKVLEQPVFLGVNVMLLRSMLFPPVLGRSIDTTLKQLLDYTEMPGVSLVYFFEGTDGFFRLRVRRIN